MSTILKRKGTVVSMELPESVSKKQRVPWRSSADKKGDVDCSSPDVFIQSMLGETKADDFFNDYWEKKPLLVHRSDPKFFGELFTLSIIKQVVKDNELEQLRDVNVGAYVDGQQKEFVEETGIVTAETIDRLMNDSKATIQFYNPQRYIDDLWNMVQKMESYFGSLVSASAYITPAGCQGSAPHCDDVENFIFQIEGKVEWKIYKPMVELSRDFTQDLAESTLGEPTHTLLLEPGDVLYFPRGMIYHCKTTEDGYSTHIVFSTYQQNTWGDFMCHAVQQAIENALEDNLNIRSGLPINFRSFLGTGKNMAEYVTDPDKKSGEEPESNLSEPRVVKFKQTVQSCLSELVNHIDVNKAADSMCAEFISGRLPPYGYKGLSLASSVNAEAVRDTETAAVYEDLSEPSDVEAAPTGDAGETAPAGDVGENKAATAEPAEDVTKTDDVDKTEGADIATAALVIPGIEDKIRIKFPDYIRVVYVGEDEDDDLDEDDLDLDDDSSDDDEVMEGISEKAEKLSDNDDDDEEVQVTDTEPHIKVLHSLHNDRFSHMGFNVFDKVGCLKFDATYAKALVKLTNSGSDFIPVKDLQMEKDEDKVLLATRLAADGLLEVQ